MEMQSASAATIAGQFILSVPPGTAWKPVMRGIADYLLRRAVTTVNPSAELPALHETLESDLPAQTHETRDGGRITVAANLDGTEDSSLDPASMTDETRQAIIDGELSRQFQPVPSIDFITIGIGSRFRLLWIITSKVDEVDDELERAGLERVARLNLESELGEKLRDTRYRMADTEPSAFIAPPIHATPLPRTVLDSAGKRVLRVDAFFCRELPYLPPVSGSADSGMTELQLAQIDYRIAHKLDEIAALGQEVAHAQLAIQQGETWTVWQIGDDTARRVAVFASGAHGEGWKLAVRMVW